MHESPIDEDSQLYETSQTGSYNDNTIFHTPISKFSQKKDRSSNDKSEEGPAYLAKYKLTEQMIKDATKAQNLSELTELVLNGNSKFVRYRLKYISGLHNMMNLKELDLSNNDIEKIENLHTLKRLKVLNLSSNKITKIEGISSLKNLEILNLSNNLIEDIPAIIMKNINLTELYLANNNISKKESINNLKSLNKLVILDLVCNPITDNQDYPNFILHVLKKLCFLDARQVRKSTALSFQAQTTEDNELRTESSSNTRQGITLGNHNNLDRSPEQRASLRSSYEQRLLSTQSKLNQIHLLNNQVQLLETEDIKEDDKPSHERQLKYDDPDNSLSNFDISGIHNDHDKSQEELLPNSADGLRFQPLERRRDSRSHGTNKFSDGPINENTLYSMSETMVDRSRMMPQSAQSTQTNWEMKALQKQIQAPESLLMSSRYNQQGTGPISLMDQEPLSTRRNHIEQLAPIPEPGDITNRSKRTFEITATPGTRLDLSAIEPASSLKGEFQEQFSLEKVVDLRKERQKIQASIHDINEAINKASLRADKKVKKYHIQVQTLISLK